MHLIDFDLISVWNLYIIIVSTSKIETTAIQIIDCEFNTMLPVVVEYTATTKRDLSIRINATKYNFKLSFC